MAVSVFFRSGRRIQTSPLLCHCVLNDFSKQQSAHRIQNTKTLFFSCQEVKFYVTMLPFQRQTKPNFREARLRLHNRTLSFCRFRHFPSFSRVKMWQTSSSFLLLIVGFKLNSSNTTTELSILTHFHTSVCFSLTCACYITYLVMYGFRASSVWTLLALWTLTLLCVNQQCPTLSITLMYTDWLKGNKYFNKNN